MQPEQPLHLAHSLSRIPIFPPTPDNVHIPEAGQSGALDKKNNAGLPDPLKLGIETLSGMSMDDVKVHYHSSKPAKVQALAYTQGSDIHVGPGQEKHLAHEAWHVVQQKQGRVKPTSRIMGAIINDDQTLEREAEIMGGRSAQGGFGHPEVSEKAVSALNGSSSSQSLIPIQRYFVHEEQDLDENSWQVQLVLEYLEDDEEGKKTFLKDLDSGSKRILLNWVKKHFDSQPRIKEKIENELNESEGKVGPIKRERVIAKGGRQKVTEKKGGAKEEVESGEEESAELMEEENVKKIRSSKAVTKKGSKKKAQSSNYKDTVDELVEWMIENGMGDESNYTVAAFGNKSLIISKVGGIGGEAEGKEMSLLKKEIVDQGITENWKIYTAQKFWSEGASNHAETCILAAARKNKINYLKCTNPNCAYCAETLEAYNINTGKVKGKAKVQKGWSHPFYPVYYGSAVSTSKEPEQVEELKKFNKHVGQGGKAEDFAFKIGKFYNTSQPKEGNKTPLDLGKKK